MLIRQFISSCSHDQVAHAALVSMGGALVARIEAHCDQAGLEPGTVVANAVRRFDQKASKNDWAALASAMSGADQPVLAGLQHILEKGFLKREAGGKPNLAAVPGPKQEFGFAPNAKRQEACLFSG